MTTLSRYGLTAAELTRIEASSPHEQAFKLARRAQAHFAGPVWENPLALSACPTEDLSDKRMYFVRYPLVLTALDALIADITAQFEAHRIFVAGGVHGGVDGVNTVAAAGGDAAWTSASATTRYTQLAALRTAFNAHRIYVTGAVHAAEDLTSIVLVPTVTANDIVGAFALANELSRVLTAHEDNETAHAAADTTNLITAANATESNSVDTTPNQAVYVWDAAGSTVAYAERDHVLRHGSYPVAEAGRFVLASMAPKSVLEGMDPSMFRAVADLAAAKALAAADLPDRGIVHIETLGIYGTDTGSALTANDVDVIRPTVWAASNGRLVRKAPASLAAWAQRTKVLFVDGTLGSDTTGNGSIAKPYATIGAALTAGGAGAVISVAPGSYAEDVTVAAAATLYLHGVSVVAGGAATGALTVSAAATLYGGGFAGATALTALCEAFGTTFTGGVAIGAAGTLRGHRCTLGSTLSLNHATALADLNGGSVAGVVGFTAAGTLRSRAVAYAAAVAVDFAGAAFLSDKDSFASTLGVTVAGALNATDAAITGVATVSGAAAQVKLDRCALTTHLVLSGADAQVRASKTTFGGDVTLTNSADLFLSGRCPIAGAVDVGAASICDLGDAVVTGVATASGAAAQAKIDRGVLTGGLTLSGVGAAVQASKTQIAGALTVSAASAVADLTDCDLPTAGAARVVMSDGRINAQNARIVASGAFPALSITGGRFVGRGCEITNNDAGTVTVDSSAGGRVLLYGGRVTNSGGGGTGDLTNDGTPADPNVLDGVQLSGGAMACGAVACNVRGVYGLGTPAADTADRVTGTALRGKTELVFLGPLAAPGVSMHAAYNGGAAIDDAVGPWTVFNPARTVQIVCSNVAFVAGAFTITGTDEDGNVCVETGVTIANTTVQGTKAFRSITRFQCADPGAGDTVELQSGNGYGVGGSFLAVDNQGINGALEAPASSDANSGTIVPTTVPNGARLYSARVQR